MITYDFSLPAVNTSGAKMENKATVESKAEVDNTTYTKTTMIKG
jgi:hypothetical protein